MLNDKKINHPIIESYVKDFINKYEIPERIAKDYHNVFEKYINNLILTEYSNDSNATYESMDTHTAFGIDGIAIFVEGQFVETIDDVKEILKNFKKVEAEFLFTQVKTTSSFDRQHIADFLFGVKRFFNSNECEINELEDFWEVKNFIYSNSSKFNKNPSLKLKYICLSSNKDNLNKIDFKSVINNGVCQLKDLNLFEENLIIDFLDIKDIINLHSKITSQLDISFKLSKQPVPYPKDKFNKIKSGYYGLIELNEFIKILVDPDSKQLRRRIFDDNIRYYLGADERNSVNSRMKEQLTGTENSIFGLLNNGVTIICDNISIII